MRILFISDIVGEPGRDMVRKKLPALFSDENPDFIVANAENAAGGKGLTKSIADDLFVSGVNAITLGNHTFDRKEVADVIEDNRVLRPANYPAGVPGTGWNVFKTRSDIKVAVVNLMGRVYVANIDCPFRKADEILKAIAAETNIIFVDFHAEITSEKIAMSYYLDGRVSALIGTHTHVQTADEKIMPQGTAYITDSGMCGPMQGVIGMNKDVVLKKYLTGINQHFVMAKGPAIMQGCIVEINDQTGSAVSIKRFSIGD